MAKILIKIKKERNLERSIKYESRKIINIFLKIKYIREIICRGSTKP